MTVPVEMFDMLILPIREADRREAHDFLKRYFEGFQHVWETTDQSIQDLPKLSSVDDCPDLYLQYLKNIVGWTKELHRITDDLTYDELRRLISISGRLWKLRGVEDTVVDVMRFATGERSRVWNWFDFRWVIPAITTPDGVAWFPPGILCPVEHLVGTDDATGTTVRITCLLTMEYADAQVYQLTGVNVIGINHYLGQASPPSTDENDYEVRLLSLPEIFGTELGEEHEGRDPWVVSIPDETDTPEEDQYQAQFESNLRVVINPAWDSDEVARMKRLIVNLMSMLLRPTGERWEIVYLDFLDQFIEDGDNSQWASQTSLDLPTVEDGIMRIGTLFDWHGADTNVPSGEWDYGAYTVRFRIVELGTPYFFPFWFMLTCWSDTVAETGYVVFAVPDDTFSSPNDVSLGKIVGDSIVELETVNLANVYPIFVDVWYMLRVTFVPTNGDNLIQVFLDGELIIEYLDTDPHTADGKAGVSTWRNFAEVDEVEVLPLPVESEYIDINS